MTLLSPPPPIEPGRRCLFPERNAPEIKRTRQVEVNEDGDDGEGAAEEGKDSDRRNANRGRINLGRRDEN